MGKIENLEEQIRALSREEFARFREWFALFARSGRMRRDSLRSFEPAAPCFTGLLGVLPSATSPRPRTCEQGFRALQG
jgi:hypothetical protein